MTDRASIRITQILPVSGIWTIYVEPRTNCLTSKRDVTLVALYYDSFITYLAPDSTGRFSSPSTHPHFRGFFYGEVGPSYNQMLEFVKK